MPLPIDISNFKDRISLSVNCVFSIEGCLETSNMDCNITLLTTLFEPESVGKNEENGSFWSHSP